MKTSSLKSLLTAILILLTSYAIAQYPNNPYSCNNSWYDSGGISGNYNSNENFNYTFIPSAGNTIRIHFTAFNTEAGDDILNVLNNGVNTAYSGTPAVPFDITSNALNGQLTANFISSSNFTIRPGWVAEVQCIGPPQTITANHNLPQPQICAGNTVTFQYISHSGGRCDGGSDSWEYQWRDGPNYNTSHIVRDWSTTPDYTTTLSSSVIYYLYMRCSGYPSGISPSSNPVVVSVYNQPVGGTAIVSSEICSGNSTTILLSGANGNSVQWQQSPDGIGLWTDLFGATSTILSTPTLSSTMYYRARVSQTGAGCVDAYSSVDTVIVHPLPVGGTVLASPPVICSGSTSSLQLTGQSGVVQWQQSSDGTNFTDVSSGSGINDPTYFTAGLSSTTFYRAKLTQNGVGCTTAYSSKDTVIVNSTPNGGIATASSPVCINNSSSVSLSGYLGNIQWQKSLNGSTWVNIPGSEGSGQNLPTYITPALTATVYYRALLSQTGSGCVDAYSVPDTMVVLPIAVGGFAVAQYPVICSGTTSILQLSGQVGNIQWQQSMDGITNWTDLTIGSGMNTTTYTTSPLLVTTYYRARLNSGVGCPVMYSSIDTVIVNQSPAGGSASANGPLCSGNSSTVNLSGYNGTIQWQQSPNGNTGWANVTGGSGQNSSVYNTPVLSNTTFYRAQLTQAGYGCAVVYSTVDTMVVHPNPVAGTAIAVSPICINNSTSVTLSGYNGNIQWQQSPNGNTGWANVNAGTGINSSTYFTPDLSNTIFYRAAVSQYGIGCQTVYSIKDTVIINPLTVGGTAIVNANPICQGSTSSVSLAGANGTIQWQQSPNGNSNWVNVTGGNGANSNLYVTPNLFSTTYYRAMVQSGVCAATASTVTVVNIDVPPNPGYLALQGANNLCSGSNSGRLRLTSYSGNILRWEASPNGTSSWYMIANTTDTLGFRNLTTTTYYRVILKNGSCANTPSNVVLVNIVPIPVADFSFNQVCFNTPVHFNDLSTINGGSISTWGWNFGPSSSTVQNPNYTYPSAGTYNVRLIVGSNYGCKDTVIKSLTQAPALQSTVNNHDNVSCYGNSDGTAHVQVTGGTLPYYYSWNTIPQQNGAYASGLAAGNYVVNINDAIGCTSSATVMINQPAALHATIGSYSNVSCFGMHNGSININVTGGTGTYHYAWNTMPPQYTQNVSNLSAGPYHVIVTDDNNCSADAFITLNEPVALEATSLVISNVKCFGGNDGKATININGGTMPYQFLWTGNYTSATVSTLTSGNYQVTVTDNNDCIANASLTITQPPQLNAQITSDALQHNCYGSFLTLNSEVTGGTPQYYYNWWSNDAPNSIYSPNSPSSLILPESTSTYFLNVTDANNCLSNTASISISVLPRIFADAGEDVIIYRGDSTQLHATFSGNYDYVYWTPANALSNTHITNPYAKPFVTTVYTVTFRDDNNCIASDSVQVLVITTNAPDSLGDLIIPRAFTPNGDGVNETWEIGNIQFYPQCFVAVYDRSGHLLFESHGYKIPWDGKNQDGELLPMGVYTYTIKLKNGRDFATGTVTLIH